MFHDKFSSHFFWFVAFKYNKSGDFSFAEVDV